MNNCLLLVPVFPGIDGVLIPGNPGMRTAGNPGRPGNGNENTSRADVQDSAEVISTVSEPAHLVAHQRAQHYIVVRPTAVRAISTDIICQTIVQRCRTSDF